MLLAKKATVSPDFHQGLRKELAHLYARRSTIDELILSLERYERCRTKRCETRSRQKTA